MWVVRAVQHDDIDSLLALVKSATRGLTSLQLDRQRLVDRVEQSVFALSRSGDTPRGEPYVLVLADTDSGEIVGTSTVYAKTGGYQPLYSYKIVTSNHHSELLEVSQERTRLDLNRLHDGPTEIGSLFLRGLHRGEGRGRWLSVARFMLIAQRRSRFADTVIAEMRGRADASGAVTFWDAVAGRFIPVSFATADAMSTVSKQFIEQMMPQHPIYLDLLSSEVRDGIGRVHDETVPAMQLLQSEGFESTDQIDIFDAGPMLSCPTDWIAAVRRCQSVTIRQIMDSVSTEGPHVILATEQGGFCSIATRIHTPLPSLQQSDLPASINISRRDADVLGLQPGDACTLMTPKPMTPSSL